MLSELWRQAAGEYGDVRFCQIRADQAIENYPDRNCPTILVYKDGDIVKQIVTLATVGGVRMNMSDIDNLLVDVGGVPETDMRVLRRRRATEEAEDDKRLGKAIKNSQVRRRGEDDDDWD